MLDKKLIKSVRSGDSSSVRRLLFLGANPNALDSKTGFRALYLASIEGNIHIARLLVSKGAEVSGVGNHSCTAMHGSLQHEQDVVTSFLLHHVSQGYEGTQSQSGLTELHVACMKSNIRAIMVLLQKGLLVNALDGNGRSALHYASMHCTIGALELLFEREGVDVNRADRSGLSPLHFAMMGRKIDNVRFLCARDDIDMSLSLPSDTKVGSVTLPRGAEFIGICRLLIPSEQRAEFSSILRGDEDSLSEERQYDVAPVVSIGALSIPPTTDRQRVYAYQTKPRKEFFDCFTHLFSQQLHIWHHIDYGLSSADCAEVSTVGSAVSAIASSSHIPFASMFISGMVSLYKWQETSHISTIASQKAIRRANASCGHDEVSPLCDMIIRAYRGVIDSFDAKTRLKPPNSGLISAFVRLLPGQRSMISQSEYFAIIINQNIIDHISTRTLFDDITLHKQLFSVVAVNAERNLGLVFRPRSIDVDSDYPIVADLRGRFAPLRSSIAIRNAIRRLYAEGIMDESHSTRRSHVQVHRDLGKVPGLDFSSMGRG